MSVLVVEFFVGSLFATLFIGAAVVAVMTFSMAQHYARLLRARWRQ